MADASYVYGEVPVSAKVFSQGQATPDELVKMASAIWREVNASGVAADDAAGNDALLERLQRTHVDFMRSFPVALRWMVQMRRYNPRAFKYYLLKHAAAELKTREDFLRLQAEYLVQLFVATTAHPTKKQIADYRQHIVDRLLEEDKRYQETDKEVEADMERLEEANARERREDLLRYAARARAARGLAEAVPAEAVPAGPAADAPPVAN